MCLINGKFQSPRTGKFESNGSMKDIMEYVYCFNPLERGNSNQIANSKNMLFLGLSFQSPRTGKFESNASKLILTRF